MKLPERCGMCGSSSWCGRDCKYAPGRVAPFDVEDVISAPLPERPEICIEDGCPVLVDEPDPSIVTEDDWKGIRAKAAAWDAHLEKTRLRMRKYRARKAK